MKKNEPFFCEIKTAKRFFNVLVFFLLITCTLSYGQTRKISFEDVKGIADRNAKELWGAVDGAEAIPYYGPDDEIIAYHFNYAVGGKFPNKQSLMHDCNEAFNKGNRDAGWGNDSYGNMVIGAKPNMPVFIEYSKCLSKQYAFGIKLRDAAKKEFGFDYTFGKTYYLGLVEVWFCVQNGKVKKYINLEPYVKVMEEAKFFQYMNEKEYFWNRDTFAEDWVQFLDQKDPIETGMVYHPGVEHVPFLEWSYGCAPTTGAMIMCWWDNFAAAGKLVEQYGEVWDPIQENMDYHVPDIQYSLKVHMQTNSSGSTYRGDIADGYSAVMGFRGYSHVADGHWAFWWTVSDLFDDIKSQINNGRPCHVSIDNHAICGVGYNNANKTIATHDPNMSSERIITRSMLEAVFWMYITSNPFSWVNIETPDGGYQWNGNGGLTKETLKSNDFYEISWNSEPLPNSFVVLSYHVEGAATPDWIEIGPTENDGEFNWYVPNITSPWGTSTEHARIKIDLYDEYGTLMASDGTYGNFNINAGGSLTEIFDMELTHSNPDFFKVNLNNPTWSVVGVRDDDMSAFWYLNFYDNIGFGNKVEECISWEYVNYIVINGHNYPTGYYGVKPYQTYNNKVEADIQWDNDMDYLPLNTPQNKTWASNRVAKIWNVHLTPGDYYFELDIDSTATLDLDMALFKWGGDNLFSRNDDIASSTNFGFAVDESFHYYAVTEGDYGLCLSSKNDCSGDYEINIHTPGKWTGAINSDWHTPGNWTSNTVPSLADNVVISSDCIHNPSVHNYHAFCKSLTIEAGIILFIDDKYLGVYGDLTVYGDLRMMGENAGLEVQNNVTFKSGSACNILDQYPIIDCYRSWTMEEGADIHINDGTVRFITDHPSYIINKSSTAYFNDIIIQKTSSHLWFNVLSTQDLKIHGDLSILSGSTFVTDSEKSIVISGDLSGLGDFQFNKGTVEFIDNSASLDFSEDSYFNNLRIATNNYSMMFDDLNIKGNLTISGEGLISLGHDIYIGGDWKNNIGPDGFLEEGSRVIFNGTEEQYCYGEHFNELELDCEELIFPSSITICQLYDYTHGNIIVDGGSFAANDLADNGIFGEIYIESGSLSFHQGTDQYVDINGELYMNGGTFNIYGGMDDSYWSYAGNAEVHMNGGILDFKDVGVRIYNGSHNFWFEALEGVVRTTGDLYCYRNDFNPSHGSFELYGPNQTQLYCVSSGNFFNVDINKDATKKSGTSNYLANPRNPEELIKNPKAFDVILSHDMYIAGDLNIVSGSLDINGYILEIDNDLNIDDKLVMNNSSDLVHVHGDIFWNQNSMSNITDGLILAEGGFNVMLGANVNLGINSTLQFYGSSISGITNNVTGTSFGDLEFNKTDNHTIVNPSSHMIIVNGAVLVYASNEVRFSGSNMECNGTFFGDDYCQLLLENYANLEVNSSFYLEGSLTINSGMVLCHDNVQINTSAEIQIDGGSCVWDRPYSASYFNVFGDVSMNDGVFEVTNEGINMGPSAQIAQDGGTVRIGWGIQGVYPGNFLASDGTLEFIGPSTGVLKLESSNFLFDLLINKTSGAKVNNLENLTIHHDVTVMNSELNIGANDFTVNGDVIIETNGVLNATNGDIYVGGDWINNAGEDGFLEGTRLVRFLGNGNSHILNDETFYDLDANINGGSYDYLWADENTTINILGDLEINSCSFRLDANATVNIEGDLIINENANLFASTTADSYINLEGNWINHNTTGYPWVNGFYYGLSTVKFTGDFDAWLQADCGVQEFYNLKISIGTADFYPYSDVTVHNDVTIIAGNWVADESNLTFTFMGDVDIWEQGEYNDNSNNVVIAGENEQQFNNGSGLWANIRNLNIQMTSTTSKSLPLFSLIGNLHVNENIVVDTGNFFINSNSIECVGNFIINENGKVTAPLSSVIAMGDGSALTVDGGEIQLYGNGTYNPKVTAISGNYEFNIKNLGTITTTNATFEYMDDGGVNIYTSGLTFGTNTFSNCTFKNGISGGSLLQINNDQDLIINEANFPDNTWGGTYNVRKVFDQGSVTFTNVTGDFSGPAYENDPYNRIGWDDLVPGIWEGTASHSWQDANNWQNNLKPTASDDAYIPSGTPNEPWVASTDQFCNNLTIEAGASLRIYDEILTVYGSMIIYGELKMDNALGVLNVGDHFGEMISWEAGSTDNITSGTINVYGDWYFKYNCNVHLGDGNTVNFFGNNRSYIYCDSPSAQFGNLQINKTAPPKDYVYVLTDDYLNVTQDLYVYDGILSISDGVQMHIGNEFYIDNGGTFLSMGTAGNETTVKGSPGYCLLEVASGGTIGAEYTLFEYIGSGGVTVNPGATVDIAHPFNHCTFQKGPTDGTLLNISNNQILTIDGANFPLTTYAPTYGVAKVVNSGHITFTNVEGAFVGSNYENDPYDLIDWPGVIPGIWIGVHSSYWAVGNNWKYYMEPGPDDDAVIAAGTPHDPVVSYGDQDCKNLIIEAGATLEILDHTLSVYDDVIIHGELIMNQNASELNAGNSFGDMISWEPGSTDNVNKGVINVYGDWYFKDGTNAQLGGGNTVLFYGDNNATIYGEDDDALFGNIKVDKTSSTHNVVFVPQNSTIRIKEDLTVQEGELRMDEGTLLTVQNELYVSDGGILNIKGTSGNEAIVSGYPSYAMFAIASGGTISAAFAQFEYFDSYGVLVENGAIIDPTYPFYHCTFRESPPGGTLLSIDNDQIITIEGANFPANTWSGDYNVHKYFDQGQVTFTDFSGDFTGEIFENDPHNRIDWFHPYYTMNLKVFLEGPFGSTMMTTDLNSIPLAQPFNTFPWNYNGLELMGEVPLKMVDWVLVELRDAPDASTAASGTIIARKAAVLTNNGHIRDLSGLINIQFNKKINHQLFVVIWHRNHLGVMSAYPLQFANDTYSYDFSTSANQAYGNSDAQKELVSGIWGMIGGNGRPDLIIDNGDYNLIWKPQAGLNGYKMGDFNLDNQVDNQDKNDILNNNYNSECQVPD